MPADSVYNMLPASCNNTSAIMLMVCAAEGLWQVQCHIYDHTSARPASRLLSDHVQPVSTLYCVLQHGHLNELVDHLSSIASENLMSMKLTATCV